MDLGVYRSSVLLLLIRGVQMSLKIYESPMAFSLYKHKFTVAVKHSQRTSNSERRVRLKEKRMKVETDQRLVYLENMPFILSSQQILHWREPYDILPIYHKDVLSLPSA